MATICPTILAENPHQYREQLERVEEFAQRIQIDLSDGSFAEPATIGPERVFWPKSLVADIHLMYERPFSAVSELLEQRPHLIIIHAEANPAELDRSFELIGASPPVRRGLALLPETEPADVERWLKQADHCLVFAGQLGSFGGKADMSQTAKIPVIKEINPNLEIGWDGGANAENTAALREAGVDVLNVGGYIQKADNARDAYAILQQIANS